MRLLLIGASGMIGNRIAAEAEGRGHLVTKASRRGGLALDARDAAQVAQALLGQQAVIFAVKADADGGDMTAGLLQIADGVMAGMRQAGLCRLIIVGGAGSLEVAPGVRLLAYLNDVPEAVKAQALAQDALLAHVRATADDLDWTYVSPGGLIEPGTRTGVFRQGTDKLLTDAEGKARISAEDYAIGMIDLVEQGGKIREHITFGY